MVTAYQVAAGLSRHDGRLPFLHVNTNWALKQLGDFLSPLEYKDPPGMFAWSLERVEDRERRADRLRPVGFRDGGERLHIQSAR